MEISLGCTYEDVVTGFQGVATGYAVFLAETNSVQLTPEVDREGRMREPQWVSCSRVVRSEDSGDLILKPVEHKSIFPGSKR